MGSSGLQTSVQLGDADARQMVAACLDVDDPSLLGHCLHCCFEIQVRRSPNAPAITDGSKTFTYEELNRRANQIARELQNYGVRPEVPVGIYVSRSLSLAISILAVLKAGGVCVPLDATYPPERLAFMLHDTAAPVLISDSAL